MTTPPPPLPRTPPSMGIPTAWLMLLSLLFLAVLTAIGRWGIGLASESDCAREAVQALAADGASAPACAAVAAKLIAGGRWARFYVWLDFGFIAAYTGFLICGLQWIHERAARAVDPKQHWTAAMWMTVIGLLVRAWGIPLAVVGGLADLLENAWLLDAMPSDVVPETLPARLVIATGLKWLLGSVALGTLVVGWLATNPWSRWMTALRLR